MPNVYYKFDKFNILFLKKFIHEIVSNEYNIKSRKMIYNNSTKNSVKIFHFNIMCIANLINNIQMSPSKSIRSFNKVVLKSVESNDVTQSVCKKNNNNYIENKKKNDTIDFSVEYARDYKLTKKNSISSIRRS